MATSKEMREKPLFRLRRGRRAGFSNSGWTGECRRRQHSA
jgi:hypothetical protein